jgi:hypothetical protein
LAAVVVVPATDDAGAGEPAPPLLAPLTPLPALAAPDASEEATAAPPFNDEAGDCC